MESFSSPEQLKKIADILSNYLRLPFADRTIPGAILEWVIATVHEGKVLKTYDYIDVISKNGKIGWQVKSTKADTPMTWKRAKIPNKQRLIEASQNCEKERQILGDILLTFCNDHALASLTKYKQLEEIGYCRLVIHKDVFTYFERPLCTRKSPRIFDPAEFEWQWSTPKVTKKKEQLPALHGIHRKTGQRQWAWNIGENQFHFPGEENWWPTTEHPNAVTFRLPTKDDKLSLDEFLKMMKSAKLPA